MKNWKMVMNIMTKEQKERELGALILSVIAPLFDLLNIVLILPFMTLLISPNLIDDSSQFSWVQKIFGYSDTKQLLLFLSATILVIYVLKLIYMVLRSRLLTKYQYKNWQELSTKIFTCFLCTDYKKQVNQTTNQLIQHIMNDTDAVFGYLRALTDLVVNIIIFLGVSIFLIFINRTIACVYCVIMLAILILIRVFQAKKIQKNGTETRECSIATYGICGQSLGAIKEIKTLHKEEFFVQRYIETTKELEKLKSNYRLSQEMPSILIENGMFILMFFTMTFIAALGIDIDAILPTLATFIYSLGKLFPSIFKLNSGMNQMKYSSKALEEVYRIVTESENYKLDLEECDDKNGVNELINALKPLHLHESVCFRNVSFRYNDNAPYILKDANLTIPAGKTIAITGMSGIGKTTCADLLMGLLQPQQGTIETDGVSIYSNKSAWANMVSYIPQSLFLSGNTIRSNVAFAVPSNEIDEDKVWSSLHSAGIDEFVRTFEQGIDTVTGFNGNLISGGQKQRIGLARAFYRSFDLLMLDESTSALDAQTEKEVLRTIQELAGKKTIVIIAHSQATIENCEIVYQIENQNFKRIK